MSFGSAPYLGGRLPAAWEGWLREAQAAGVQVVVFVPPLNTKLARTLTSETHYLEHLDLLRYYLRSLATRYHIAVHDLSTVDRFGGDDRWFIDGTHMIGPNNDLVLKAILKDVPRAEPRVAVR